MTVEIVVSDPVGPVLAAFLASNSPKTQEAYSRDLDIFRRWIGAGTLADAARKILASPGDANLTALRWKNDMVAQGLAAATINRRTSALRRLVAVANIAGIVSWQLQVSGLKPEARRDVRGPTWIVFGKVLEGEPSVKVRALLALLGMNGLRISEALSIDLADVAVDYSSVRVEAKGKRERQTIQLRGAPADALKAWVAERGRSPGRIFDTSYASARRWIKAAGDRVGVRLAPHQLRHCAISRALDVTDGDVRSVRAYSRHASVDMVIRYDDARSEDLAAAVAAKVSAP